MAEAELQRVPTLHGDFLLSPTAPFFLDSPPPVGPCEVQDTLWRKMSAAVAGPNKKRKKADTKPQSQITKCLNEKRRREQENIFIEELAELISASFADMSSLSVKPDKCAILQETVNQIRHIKQQETSATSDAVQQGEVSSSKPTVLANEVLGPLLLEALEGFLFVVNLEGKVEYVTDNVSQYIRFSKEEVLGKSIYNYIHHGDHTRFSSNLLPTCSWSSLDSNPPNQQQTHKSFNCRFLIKPPDDQEETMEEKQQRVSKYENMQISSTQLSYPCEKGNTEEESGDSGPCLMCIARRILPNENHIGLTMEQFTFKLDSLGNRIIWVDNSGLSSTYSKFFNKDLVKKDVQDLCYPSDKGKLTSHIEETLSVGQSTSEIIRIRCNNTQENYISVLWKSKLFKATGPEPEFIMTTVSIIGEKDVANESSSPPSLSSNCQNSGAVGGPLIGNVKPSSGGRLPSNELSASSVGLSASANAVPFSSGVPLSTSELFEFDIFPSSTSWDMQSIADERNPWERPESRQSMPSPLNSYPPPPTLTSPPPPSTPSYPQAQSFPFSPVQESPSTHQLEDNTALKSSKEGENSMDVGDSARLRNLLLTKRLSTETDEGTGSQLHNKHHILKTLLNQDDEEQNISQPIDQTQGKSSTAQENKMLLKLLNEKSDDDDVETKAGLKTRNELLQQLLKDEESCQDRSQVTDESLMKALSSGNSPGGNASDSRGRKRPSEEGDEATAKRVASILDSLPGGASNSSGNSKLWEKNKMLASLLAKQPSTPATIPPIPASILSATPQEKMPRVVKQQQSQQGWMNASSVVQPQTNRNGQSQQAQQRSPVSRTPNSFNSQSWDSSDPILSDLLDQVIEIVPDTATDSPALINIINSMESPNPGGVSTGTSYQQDLSEKMAINAIQKSLMQCETVVKNPSYPNSNQVPAGQQFPPPPLYSHRQRFPLQGQLQGRQPGHQFVGNQQQLLIQHNRQSLLQQQQKQRLLQQQQQQQLLIPSNATTTPDSGLHNIDSIINNSVAPNVSLQRSSSVPESQLSPVGVGNFSSGNNNSILNSGGSQISPGQRQPYSPQSFPTVNGGMNSFQNPTSGQQGGQQARLSPSGPPNYQPQLSPRVSQGQQVYSNQGQGASWSQQPASRISIQQQQNPMLNAQLTTTGGGQRQLPPVRSLTSPGSRQSPFPPEISPTAASSYQFQRLQRTTSAPQATTQLPGGALGVRQYAKEQHGGLGAVGPLLSQPYPQHHSVSFSQESPQPLFCYDHPSSMYGGGGSVGDRSRSLPGGNNGMTEYVRQELRAMVGARTGTSGAAPRQSIPQPTPAQGMVSGQQVSPDLDALGLSFEMPTPAVSDNPKLWNNLSDLGSSSPQSGSVLPSRASTMDEVSRNSDSKSSLLQKLLSE